MRAVPCAACAVRAASGTRPLVTCAAVLPVHLRGMPVFVASCCRPSQSWRQRRRGNRNVKSIDKYLAAALCLKCGRAASLHVLHARDLPPTVFLWSCAVWAVSGGSRTRSCTQCITAGTWACSSLKSMWMNRTGCTSSTCARYCMAAALIVSTAKPWQFQRCLTSPFKPLLTAK